MNRLLPLFVVFGFAGAKLTLGSAEPDASPACETYTYKKVGTLEIKADVYRPPVDRARRPVVVYMHGGSLINGGRASKSFVEHPLLPAFLNAGYVVVSVDYRLAPETKLPALVEDIEDAFRWVREKGPSLFGADPDRVAAAGASAGGYLTLLAGIRVHPRPVVLYAESSYADLISPWHLRASVHPPHYADSHLNDADAWQQVSGPPIANSEDRHGDGSAFNDFIRRTARWPKAISNWDPLTEAGKYLPYLPVRNVTPDYPPTFMIHGEKDTDVSAELPKAMAAELAKKGVEHRLILIPGGEHGFRGGDPKLIAAAEQEAIAFVRAHLDAKAAAFPVAPLPPTSRRNAAASEHP